MQHIFLKTTGNLPGESTPADLAELARRHPEATFICGHTGGNVEAAIPEIRDCRNIYADLCGTDPRAGVTELVVRELGARRVLYGSDAGGRSFASRLAKIHGADTRAIGRRGLTDPSSQPRPLDLFGSGRLEPNVNPQPHR